jgi:hypothetical protein
MFAHLYKKRGGGFTLIINAEVRTVNAIYEFAVKGKRDANQICKLYNAKAWNF